MSESYEFAGSIEINGNTDASEKFSTMQSMS